MTAHQLLLDYGDTFFDDGEADAHGAQEEGWYVSDNEYDCAMPRGECDGDGDGQSDADDDFDWVLPSRPQSPVAKTD